MFDHFDLLANVYDKLISAPDLSSLQKLLDLPTSGWMLDAGGGTGRVSAGLRQFLDRVVVCDASLKMLGQSAGKGDIAPVKGDVAKLPFSNNSFERIVVVDALHHFKKPHDAIKEFFRVIKPGGKIVIEEFNIKRFPVKLIAWAEKIMLMGSHFFTPDEIKEMLENSGFSASIDNPTGIDTWVVGEKVS